MHQECKNLNIISFNIYDSLISTCRLYQNQYMRARVRLFLALQEFIFRQIIYGMLLQHNTSDYNEALLSSYRHH